MLAFCGRALTPALTPTPTPTPNPTPNQVMTGAERRVAGDEAAGGARNKASALPALQGPKTSNAKVNLAPDPNPNQYPNPHPNPNPNPT